MRSGGEQDADPPVRRHPERKERCGMQIQVDVSGSAYENQASSPYVDVKAYCFDLSLLPP